MRLQYEHGERTGKDWTNRCSAISVSSLATPVRHFQPQARSGDGAGPGGADRVSRVQCVGGRRPGTSPDASFGLQTTTSERSPLGRCESHGHAGRWNRIYVRALRHVAAFAAGESGVQFNDPTRDWSTDMNENVHTATASLDLPHIARRTAARSRTTTSTANARYVYLLPWTPRSHDRNSLRQCATRYSARLPTCGTRCPNGSVPASRTGLTATMRRISRAHRARSTVPSFLR